MSNEERRNQRGGHDGNHDSKATVGEFEYEHYSREWCLHRSTDHGCGTDQREGSDGRSGPQVNPHGTKERAEDRLKSNDPQVDYPRAEDALQRAEARLTVAKQPEK